MAEKTNANIGFEKQLWDAACVLWGHIPAAEYRKVIIGLIFLRYISAAFDKRYKELVDEGDGFEDDRDAYEMDNVFFVPEKALEIVVSILDEEHVEYALSVVQLYHHVQLDEERGTDVKRHIIEIVNILANGIVDLFPHIQIKGSFEHGLSLRESPRGGIPLRCHSRSGRFSTVKISCF